MIIPVPARSGPDEFRIFRGLFLFGLFVGLVSLGYAARAVLLPFLLGGVLAYVLNPLVTFLEMRGLRRGLAVAGLYVAVIAVATALFYLTFSVWREDVPRLRREWPAHAQRLHEAAAQTDAYLSHEWPWLAERTSLRGLVKDVLPGKGTPSRPIQARHFSQLASLALGLFLVPFAGFFLLKGGRSGFQIMLDACPGRWVEKFLSLLHRMDEVIGGYLRGVLTEAFLVGTCAGVGLAVIGVEYAAILGTAALLLNLVPFLGPAAAGLLAVTAAFLQFGTFLAPAQVALLFLSLRLLDDFLFQPLVMNRAVHLHPALVVFSILAGHEVAGVWGLLLAVPTVSVAKEAFLVAADWYRSERGRRALPESLSRAAERPWVV